MALMRLLHSYTECWSFVGHLGTLTFWLRLTDLYQSPIQDWFMWEAILISRQLSHLDELLELGPSQRLDQFDCIWFYHLKHNLIYSPIHLWVLLLIFLHFAENFAFFSHMWVILLHSSFNCIFKRFAIEFVPAEGCPSVFVFAFVFIFMFVFSYSCSYLYLLLSESLVCICIGRSEMPLSQLKVAQVDF